MTRLTLSHNKCFCGQPAEVYEVNYRGDTVGLCSRHNYYRTKLEVELGLPKPVVKRAIPSTSNPLPDSQPS